MIGPGISMTLIIFCVAHLALAQSSAEDKISRAAALEDLDLLRNSLTEIHPSLYRYTSKMEFEREFEKIRSSISDSITMMVFTNLVVPFVTKIHCGHTFMMIPYLNPGTKALPLDVKILNNQLYVIRNLSGGSQGIAGSAIKKINEYPIDTILNVFRDREVADGFNTTTKDRNVERNFKWYYAAYFEQPDTFRIVIENMSGKQEVILVPSLTDLQIQSNRSEEIVEKPLSFLGHKERDVAVLKIISFMANSVKKEHGQSLRKVVRNAFKELKNQEINNLIIDIRDNTGGMAYVPPFIYRYLGTEKFRFKKALMFHHGYRFKYSGYRNRSKFSDWLNRQLTRKIDDSTYQWTLHNNTVKTHRIKRNAFKGKVYVLVNGLTGSAACEFATLVHHNRRGIFIGEDSGGDYNGVNGYDRTYLELPHSKLYVIMPGFRSIMPWNEVNYFGRGVPVDYNVSPQISDILTGRDTELEFTFKLIEP